MLLLTIETWTSPSHRIASHRIDTARSFPFASSSVQVRWIPVPSAKQLNLVEAKDYYLLRTAPCAKVDSLSFLITYSTGEMRRLVHEEIWSRWVLYWFYDFNVGHYSPTKEVTYWYLGTYQGTSTSAPSLHKRKRRKTLRPSTHNICGVDYHLPLPSS